MTDTEQALRDRIQELEAELLAYRQADTVQINGAHLTPEHRAVIIRSFLSTEQLPILAQAYQGYVRHGLGAIFVGWRWWVTHGELEFVAQSHYLDRDSIKRQVPQPINDEIQTFMDYDPLTTAIVVFYGSEASQPGHIPTAMTGELSVHRLTGLVSGLEAMQTLGVQARDSLIFVPQ